MLKILHLTDIEGKVMEISGEILQDLDMVIISGDLTIGSISIKNIRRTLEQIRNSIPDNIPIYFVPGNRDHEENLKIVDDGSFDLINIHGKCEKIDLNEQNTIFLVGFGGALPGFLNNFTRTEEEIGSSLQNLFENLIAQKKPGDYIILVVHNPPINSKLDKTFTNLHIGSKEVRRIIEEFDPDLCLCGHVHESKSIEKIKKTVCINPGASNSGNGAIINISNAIAVKLVNIEPK